MKKTDNDLLLLGKKILGGLPIAPPWQAEVYLERTNFRESGWAEKKPEDTRSGFTQGLTVRALREGRQGVAFANDVSVEAGRRLWQSACEAATLLPPDPHRRLPAPAPAAARASGVDNTLFSATLAAQQARLARLEKKLLFPDKRLKKAVRLQLSESMSESAVVNSLGVAARQTASDVSFSLEVMGEQKGEVQTGWAYRQARFWKDLDIDAALSQARERVLNSFDAKPLTSGAWPVVFDPWVGVDFLELVTDALAADRVQRGRSLWAGKTGQEVASRLVTLIDDGSLPRGVASSPFDDEGVPRRKNILVQQGALREYLYDTYTAAREGRDSTGNAGRAGGGAPSPEPSNFYMAPGDQSRQSLLQGTPKGFLVQEVLGMHTADAVSGDFSVGASGLLIERGRPVRAVKGVTLAGNLADLFKRVDAVADDLTWFGGMGAPTFRVSSLSIGGS